MALAHAPHRNGIEYGKVIAPFALCCLLFFCVSVKVEADESSIQYGQAGTWLKLDQQHTVLLENRRLGQTLGQVALAAAVSASSGLIPTFFGVNNPTVYQLIRLTALALPGLYYLYRNLSSENHQWLSNPITIAGDATLSGRMTLVLEHDKKVAMQQLLFRQSPSTQNLRPSSVDIKKEHPLNRLSRILTNLGCDYLSLRWFSQQRPHLTITLSGEHYKTLIIDMPEWSAALATQTFVQAAPAILNLLRPKNLEMLGTLLLSAHKHRFSSIPGQPAEQLSMEPLMGQRLGTHYWLPLSVRNNPTSLLWSFSDRASTVFPAAGEPLTLHVRLTESAYPSQYSQAIHLLKPWQTDLLAMAPYSALYLLMDYLLGERLFDQGLAIPLPVIGAMLGAWLSGSLHDDFPGSGNPLHPVKSPDTSALFLADQQALISAIEESGAPQPVPEIYQEDTTQEPTLTHQGNNCFFNATLSHMAHTLTDDELEGIASNRYITKRKFNALPKEEKDAYQKLRNTFVGLMKGIRLQAFISPADHPPDGSWEILQKSFQQALFNYTVTTHDTSLESVLLGGGGAGSESRSMQNFCQSQSDAHEFMAALQRLFRLENDTSGNFIIGSEREIHVGDQVGTQINVSPNTRYNMLSVGIPEERSIRHQKISDIDSLVNRGFLHKLWVDSEDNLFHLSPQRARQFRITDREVRKYGGMYPFYDQVLLAHSKLEKLQHINVHLTLYKPSGKLSGVGRRLLHGQGTIHLPVQSTSDKSRHMVSMEPHSMILHQGATMHSGHYITAVYRDNSWFIHDDLVSHAVEIKPADDVISYGKTPLDLLSSYLENNSLDPYIINYRRVDAHP